MFTVKSRVSAVIVNKGKILLIHRWKNGEEYWVFPGGGVEPGETAKIAVVREVAEETSLIATHPIFWFEDDQGWGNSRNLIFKCKANYAPPVLAGPELKSQSSDNRYQPEWLDIKELQEKAVHPTASKVKVLEEYANQS